MPNSTQLLEKIQSLITKNPLAFVEFKVKTKNKKNQIKTMLETQKPKKDYTKAIVILIIVLAIASAILTLS